MFFAFSSAVCQPSLRPRSRIGPGFDRHRRVRFKLDAAQRQKAAANRFGQIDLGISLLA
jgi:hypothetical protein